MSTLLTKEPQKTYTCAYCQRTFTKTKIMGRKPKYCCKQHAYNGWRIESLNRAASDAISKLISDFEDNPFRMLKQLSSKQLISIVYDLGYEYKKGRWE